MTSCFLLLGTNLGEREQNLQKAQRLLQEKVGQIMQQSSVYETEPWGVTQQPAYLNQVLIIATPLSAEECLNITQSIENQMGRVRKKRWESRLIDIDMLYFGQEIIQTPHLTIPHPRLQERLFTLIPLAEIAPNFVHPLFQKNQQTLLSQCSDTNEVSLW